ncbi:four helix bundle protein [Calditrichota bacterium LG25]
MKNEKINKDFRERLLNFSVEIIKFLKTIPYRKEYDVLRYQLSKSATSIGANYEESQASTYKEFINKNRIALREAKESIYWLKIIKRLQIGNLEILENLISECKEISNIFGAIVSKADNKKTYNE